MQSDNFMSDFKISKSDTFSQTKRLLRGLLGREREEKARFWKVQGAHPIYGRMRVLVWFFPPGQIDTPIESNLLVMGCIVWGQLKSNLECWLIYWVSEWVWVNAMATTLRFSCTLLVLWQAMTQQLVISAIRSPCCTTMEVVFVYSPSIKLQIEKGA